MAGGTRLLTPPASRLRWTQGCRRCGSIPPGRIAHPWAPAALSRTPQGWVEGLGSSPTCKEIQRNQVRRVTSTRSPQPPRARGQTCGPRRLVCCGCSPPASPGATQRDALSWRQWAETCPVFSTRTQARSRTRKPSQGAGASHASLGRGHS